MEPTATGGLLNRERLDMFSAPDERRRHEQQITTAENRDAPPREGYPTATKRLMRRLEQ